MQKSKVLNFFEEISAIPRASFNEEAISNYIVEFAKERNLEVTQDAMFNVVIIKPASKGYENVPALMLQSHIDMVAEMNKGCTHNFDTDPLDLYVEDGFLKAKGTTLGADDGAGVAYMLAALDNDDLKHPRLECIFTVQEETGLTGADFLDTSNLQAKLCIGLDGSGEVETYVSSCGGVRGLLESDVERINANTKGLHLEVKGLLGGHSGGDIHLERGNANKILSIILKRALKEFPELQIGNIQGGLKDNAITRESEASFIVNEPNKFITWFEDIKKELLFQYKFSEPGLELNVVTQDVKTVVSSKDTYNIVTMLFMLPYGVIQKSMAIEDLVITSANIGTVNLVDSKISITVSLRATQSFVIENVMMDVSELSNLFGFEVTYSAKYPGWDFDEVSPLRKKTKEVYQKLRNSEMEEVATHGGLELGIWKDKLPELDIVSFGPIMFDIHTPQERLDLASFDRTYEFLEAVIESTIDLND